MGGSVLVLSSSTGANIQELEASPDVPIAPLVLEFLTSNFYGNETEWGYGFTFSFTASDGSVRFGAIAEGVVPAGAKQEMIEGTHARNRRAKRPNGMAKPRNPLD